MIDKGGQGSSRRLRTATSTYYRAPGGKAWPDSALLFGCGPLRQLADNRQYISLIVTGFDHHEDRNEEDDAMQNRVEREMMARRGPYDGSHHPIDDQPGGEEIQALKSVEPDDVVVLESAGREHDDGGDPADGRYVAENGRRAG